tara:strand:- start:1470 stop:2132 length:663 start_codon:yes stop_codon:yes gene_type:complete
MATIKYPYISSTFDSNGLISGDNFSIDFASVGDNFLSFPPSNSGVYQVFINYTYEEQFRSTYIEYDFPWMWIADLNDTYEASYESSDNLPSFSNKVEDRDSTLSFTNIDQTDSYGSATYDVSYDVEYNGDLVPLNAYWNRYKDLDYDSIGERYTDIVDANVEQIKQLLDSRPSNVIFKKTFKGPIEQKDILAIVIPEATAEATAEVTSVTSAPSNVSVGY